MSILCILFRGVRSPSEIVLSGVILHAMSTSFSETICSLFSGCSLFSFPEVLKTSSLIFEVFIIVDSLASVAPNSELAEGSSVELNTSEPLITGRESVNSIPLTSSPVAT